LGGCLTKPEENKNNHPVENLSYLKGEIMIFYILFYTNIIYY